MHFHLRGDASLAFRLTQRSKYDDFNPQLTRAFIADADHPPTGGLRGNNKKDESQIQHHWMEGNGRHRGEEK